MGIKANTAKSKQPLRKGLQLTMLALQLSTMLFLTGCWDNKDLKNVDVVVAMALDYPQNQAPHQKEITLELLKASQALEIGTMNSSRVITSGGDTVLEAISGFYGKGVKELSLPHNRLLVLGKDVGKNSTGDYLDYFVRSYKIRPTTMLVTTDTTGKELLSGGEEAEGGNGYRVSYQTLSVLDKNRSGNQGLFIVTLQDFIYAEKAQGLDPVLPLVKTKDENLFAENEININSFVVFKDGKQLGELTPEESRGYLWLKDFKKIPSIGLDVPNHLQGNQDGGVISMGVISMDVVSKKVNCKVVNTPQGNRLDFVVHAKAGIRETAFYAKNEADPKETSNQLSAEELSQLEQEINQKMQQDIGKAFAKSQSLNGDFLGLGQQIYAHSPQAWQALNQKSYLQNLTITVDVHSKIVFLGDTVAPVSN